MPEQPFALSETSLTISLFLNRKVGNNKVEVSETFKGAKCKNISFFTRSKHTTECEEIKVLTLCLCTVLQLSC